MGLAYLLTKNSFAKIQWNRIVIFSLSCFPLFLILNIYYAVGINMYVVKYAGDLSMALSIYLAIYIFTVPFSVKFISMTRYVFFFPSFTVMGTYIESRDAIF